MRKVVPIKIRLAAKIDSSGDPDDCHEWIGKHVNRRGYGRIVYQGKRWLAHRLVFFLEYGWLPPMVLHRCDNSKCCNIRHLEAGDHAKNTADAVARGRTNRKMKKCRRGHPRTKENIYIIPSTGGWRCRICRRITSEKKRAAIG